MKQRQKLLTRVLRLEIVLKKLFEIKKHKEDFGKDAFYNQFQPKAWADAKIVLEEHP